MLLDAIKSNDVELVKQLLLKYLGVKNSKSSPLCQSKNEGLPINRPDEDGWTPLHWAAALGNCNIIMLLLKTNAKADIQTRDGRTALELALKRGHIEACELLSNVVKVFSSSVEYEKKNNLHTSTTCCSTSIYNSYNLTSNPASSKSRLYCGAGHGLKVNSVELCSDRNTAKRSISLPLPELMLPLPRQYQTVQIKNNIYDMEKNNYTLRKTVSECPQRAICNSTCYCHINKCSTYISGNEVNEGPEILNSFTYATCYPTKTNNYDSKVFKLENEHSDCADNLALRCNCFRTNEFYQQKCGDYSFTPPNSISFQQSGLKKEPQLLTATHITRNNDCESNRDLLLRKSETIKGEYFGPNNLRATLKTKKNTVTKTSRRCYDCGTTSTPQWRRGRRGTVMLCNACGLKFMTPSKRIEKNRRRRELYALSRFKKLQYTEGSQQ
ncbi:hypothetical protein Zmor_003881 [Zophobas morio]|jgi:hypothetical protein|uniref:GATA-type domain-containing protein n=1 Tax=Zophobas morio TaxID=2755281 RepID=A0AA38HLY1_9CUCU|nr:hypothetical protein Zmor_003881 [Zophobas morio]